jgi:hypothetical protein
MSAPRIVAALLALAHAGCSLAFVPRPPRDGGRCEAVGNLALPVLDAAVAAAALGYGTLRTFDPLCDTARPCEPGQKEWGALVFGLLVAAPFAVSSTLGFLWRGECERREPQATAPSDEE